MNFFDWFQLEEGIQDTIEMSMRAKKWKTIDPEGLSKTNPKVAKIRERFVQGTMSYSEADYMFKKATEERSWW